MHKSANSMVVHYLIPWAGEVMVKKYKEILRMENE